MNKNAWDGCDVWDNRPKSLPQGLRVLADWFDAVYEDQGKNDAVQQDLRRWASDYEELEAKLNDEAALAEPDCKGSAPAVRTCRELRNKLRKDNDIHD